MDRLLIIEPKELIMHLEVGEQSQASIRLKNVMHTMPVAFMVQATPLKKYIIKPSHGIIPPLGVAGVEITLCPQSELPESIPLSEDQFLVNSVVVPGGGNNGSVSLDWFTAKKKQVFSDRGMRVILIGGGILRRLVARGSMEDIREVAELDERLVDSQDEQGRTPMHIAVASRRPELVQLLLELMADLEIKNASGQTVLHEAASQGEALIVELLLARGAQANSRNASGCTPLHNAVMGQHAKVVHFLVENGADVNAVMEDGRTALHMAVEQGKHECIAALLEKGAWSDVRWGEDGETPLHIAASKGDGRALELLLRHGANRDVQNKRGQTPRDVAAALVQKQGFSLLNELILGDELRVAARKGKLEDLQLCLRKGALVDGKDEHGWTALHCAAFKGHMGVVSHLVKKGADLTSRDCTGYTPLHCAIEAAQKDVVRLLIKHGAAVDARNDGGPSAFDLAFHYKYMEDMQMLLNFGDTEKVDKGEQGVSGMDNSYPFNSPLE